MIEIKNLNKKYKKNLVLQNINLTIQDNKITFLMGENGAGKTTLLKSILKLESYDGDILFDGKPIEGVYGDISVVYDDSPLYMELNGNQNIRLLCNHEPDNTTIKNVALKFLNEEQLRKKVSNYSYGQRKKLSIIIALLNDSKYIFMDEVSNGLDYETMQQLKKTLKDCAKNSVVFLTGHQFDFYNEIVDDILLLKDKNLTHYNTTEIQKLNLGSIYEKSIKDI